jgi:hypothetical protein
MSVFSFGKTDRVWGLNNRITYGMIEWWIEQAGPKPYLLEIKESYDNGYNHGDMEKVANEDKAELRDLVEFMLTTGYERRCGMDASATARIRQSIGELWRLLNADLEGTRFHKSSDAASPPSL